MDLGIFDYIASGVQAVFLGPAAFEIFGIGVSTTVLMVFVGFLAGIIVGATPGLAGPMAMAVATPILIGIFGVGTDALLPVLGCLIGIMKGATIGGAVPAILFNTPGTPDALTTTYDGFPMARQGQAGKALRVAHLSSVTGDTFSDIVLIFTAPFLAIWVERYLGFPEKAALILLSLSFIAALVGNNVWKGLLAAAFGMFIAMIGTGSGAPRDPFAERLTFGWNPLAGGLDVGVVVIGVLILGEVFKSVEDLVRGGIERRQDMKHKTGASQGITRSELADLAPTVGVSAVIGTIIGALPGVGSTLAATLGYRAAGLRKRQEGKPALGNGNQRGVAATEAANSAVSGANLIPVLTLGIPGNAAAVFLILAMDSIDGFNPGAAAMVLRTNELNPELVMAFGIFTAMLLANAFNWTIGGLFMRRVGVLSRVPKHILMPIVLLLALTATYAQLSSMTAIVLTCVFGLIGYLMRKVNMSVLPFVIAFILTRGENGLEVAMRKAFAATGSDPWFLFSSPVSIGFMVASVLVIIASFTLPKFTNNRSHR